MTDFRVTADGATVSGVTSLEYETKEGKSVSVATITVLNTPANRNTFTTGTPVTVERQDPSTPGSFETEFRGEVTAKPSENSRRNLTLSVEAEALSGRLEFAKVSRPFINVDSGVAVRRAATTVAEPSNEPAYISTGSDIGKWSSDANAFELADISEKSLNKFGDNLLYADFAEGDTGTFTVGRTNIDPSTVPGRRILRVDTRMTVNNTGGVFDAELELTDNGGTTYVWELDLPDGPGFKTFELRPADATFGGGELTESNALEIRVKTDGPLPEHRALAIDMVRTVPFTVIDRDTGLSTAVEETGRTITRTLEGSILEVANQIATEDGAIVYVDDQNVLHLERAGTTTAAATIDDTFSTAVIDVEVDRDFDVTNRVTVVGKDDKQATFEDKASINFYNEQAPRQEPIVDTTLRTDADLRARGRGYLNDNAWEDTSMSFTLANAAFRDVNVGELIDVSWPPEDIDGTFIVSSKQTDDNGYVTLGMTGSTES